MNYDVSRNIIFFLVKPKCITGYKVIKVNNGFFIVSFTELQPVFICLAPLVTSCIRTQFIQLKNVSFLFSLFCSSVLSSVADGPFAAWLLFNANMKTSHPL